MIAFASSWETHKNKGTPLCWLFQRGGRDEQEFVALIYDGKEYVAYQGHGTCMEQCQQLYFLNAPMNRDGDESPHELHVEVRLVDGDGTAPIELHVDAERTFSTLHEWVRDEVIRFVNPSHYDVGLGEESNTLRVKPTLAFLKGRIPVDVLKIGVVGTIHRAPFEEEVIIALNLAFDEAIDEQPAKNVQVSVYDGNWFVALHVIRIADERGWKWIREGEPADEAYGMNPQIGDTIDNHWFLECDALVRIGASPASLAIVKMFREMDAKAHIYEYDFPIFG